MKYNKNKELRIKLQQLYDLVCEVNNIAPDEEDTPSDEWENFFAECENLYESFIDIGTEDGIVPEMN